MRQPSIIRISVPRREPPAPPPKRHPARALLKLLSRCERLLEPAAPSTLNGSARRVLAALPRRSAILARDVGTELGMDAGYLSRSLGQLEAEGLIERGAADDRRSAPITLTAAGRLVLRQFEQRRERTISQSLEGLPEADRNRLADALAKAEALLAKLEPERNGQ